MTAVDRFLAKTKRAEDGPIINGVRCLLWTASKTNGYGVFWTGTRLVRAQRFAWEMVNEPIPAGMMACHLCDVPRCVEPTHVYCGTAHDNMMDRHPEQRSEVMRRWNAARDPAERSAAARKRTPPTPAEQGRRSRMGWATMTPEQRSNRQRKAAQSVSSERWSEIRRKAWAKKTPEQRSKIAAKTHAAQTPEQRRARALKAWETRRKNADSSA